MKRLLVFVAVLVIVLGIVALLSGVRGKFHQEEWDALSLSGSVYSAGEPLFDLRGFAVSEPSLFVNVSRVD